MEDELFFRGKLSDGIPLLLEYGKSAVMVEFHTEAQREIWKINDNDFTVVLVNYSESNETPTYSFLNLENSNYTLNQTVSIYSLW